MRKIEKSMVNGLAQDERARLIEPRFSNERLAQAGCCGRGGAEERVEMSQTYSEDLGDIDEEEAGNFLRAAEDGDEVEKLPILATPQCAQCRCEVCAQC